jgi:hypothetical protein
VIIQQEDDQIYNEEDVVLNIPAEENVSNGIDPLLVDGEIE